MTWGWFSSRFSFSENVIDLFTSLYIVVDINAFFIKEIY